jgi:hypothetical protein
VGIGHMKYLKRLLCSNVQFIIKNFQII